MCVFVILLLFLCAWFAHIFDCYKHVDIENKRDAPPCVHYDIADLFGHSLFYNREDEECTVFIVRSCVMQYNYRVWRCQYAIRCQPARAC